MKKSVAICVIIILLINILSPLILATNELNNEINNNEEKINNNSYSQIENKDNTNEEEIVKENETQDKTNEEETNNEQINDVKTKNEDSNKQEDYNIEQNSIELKSNNIETNNINTKSIQKAEGRFIIDSPVGVLYEGKNIIIDGWLMSTDEKASMKVYIDGKDTKALVTRRIQREDVLSVVHGYGGRDTNKTPGFEIKLDVSNITYGNHRIRYVLIDGNNQEISSQEKIITIDNRTRGRFLIDNPTGNLYEGKSITIDGWLMSTDEKASIKVYIDGKDTRAVINRRIARQDVLNIIQGYGGRNTNPNPGFEIKLDVSNITYGNHRVKYVLIDRNNQEISSQEKIITIDNRTRGRFLIDNPTGNLYEGKSITIDGWLMSTDEKASMKVYIDGKDTGAVVNRRIAREDVLNAVPGYGGRNTNKTPGFEIKLDVSNITYGNHKIRYVLIDRNNQEISSQTKNIIIDNRAKGRFIIDNPKESLYEGKSITIDGWQMSTDEKASMKVYIDGKDTKAVVNRRIQREDVLNAVPGYGGRNTNPNPGFEIELDISNITYGNHTVRYVLVDRNNQEISSQTKNIIIDSRTKGIFFIDNPKINYFEGDKVTVDGWMLCNDKNANIKVYIDKKNANASINNRYERQDVLESVPGYGGKKVNPKPGFDINLDLSNYEKGKKHTLEFIVYVGNEEVATRTKEMFFYSKDVGWLCIDVPEGATSSGNNLTFKGWEMSELPDSQIKIYINNVDMNAKVTRTKRQDVLNAIKGYGGEDVNKTPGFEATISTQRLVEGTYVAEIRLYSKEGKILATQYRQVTATKHFGIDVSTHQGNINWNQAQQYFNYALIRIGWVGNESFSIDAKFERNYKACIENNIPVGIYVYSYATSVESAQKVAYKVLEWLKGRNLNLPVFFDIEQNELASPEFKVLNTQMAKRFCSIIQSNGYRAGVYSYMHFFRDYMNMNELENDYDIWVAQYNDICTYQGRYDIWQYTSSGSIPGIPGNVDFNVFYKNY